MAPEIRNNIPPPHLFIQSSSLQPGGRRLGRAMPPTPPARKPGVASVASRDRRAITVAGGPRDAMGRAARMATSSLHLTMECRDAPAERLEQVPRRPGPELARS
jgi:hypothetical protein